MPSDLSGQVSSSVTTPVWLRVVRTHWEPEKSPPPLSPPSSWSGLVPYSPGFDGGLKGFQSTLLLSNCFRDSRRCSSREVKHANISIYQEHLFKTLIGCSLANPMGNEKSPRKHDIRSIYSLRLETVPLIKQVPHLVSFRPHSRVLWTRRWLQMTVLRLQKVIWSKTTQLATVFPQKEHGGLY